MAIDDNKVYGLLGSQIKDLPDKIEEIKGLARELTTDDYNYPVNNPDGVALWLMPAGIYYSHNKKVYVTNASYAQSDFYIVGKPSGYVSRPILHLPIGSTARGTIYMVDNTGIQISYAGITTQIIDNLTSTSTDSALSANQGKVLKGLIDAITGFSYEVVQTLPASGQNGKIYLVPIDESGGPSTNYYDEYIWVNNTWEQIGTTEMDLTNYVQFSDLATVATTGDYDDLNDKPTIPSVVQTTGTSTTDVMSQNAVTSMVYKDPSTKKQVFITGSTGGLGTDSMAIGYEANGSSNANQTVSLGAHSQAVYNGTVALGAYSGTNAVFNANGIVAINSTNTSYGYNSSNNRVLRGVYDPQRANDAATKGYVDTGLSAKADSSSLATVATSGSYSDLSNKPTIPTVNDSTITITNNGTTVDSFTTNASSNKTIALSAPVITMTDTDPGEGSALAANNYVAVYGESGLIDTADIATGAVTASKIDFTSFNSTSVGGVASTVIHNAGDASELRLFRVGNLVIANGTFVLSGLGTYDQFSISNTVPLGFRPSLSMVDNANKIYLPFTGSTSNINGGWSVSHDGEMWFSISTAFSGSVRFFYNATYLTDDDYPSQS